MKTTKYGRRRKSALWLVSGGTLAAIGTFAAALFLPLVPTPPAFERTSELRESASPNLAILMQEARPEAPKVLAPKRPDLPERFAEVSLKIRPGDDLSSRLEALGIETASVRALVAATSETFDLRRMKAGQVFNLKIDTRPADPEADKVEAAVAEIEAAHQSLAGAKPTEALVALRELQPLPAPRIAEMNFDASSTEEVSVHQGPDGEYEATRSEKMLTTELARAEGKIRSSFYVAAESAGVPVPTILDLIRMYSYKVDFQRDISRGDSFEVYFSKKVDDRGRVVARGDVLFAALTVNQRRYELWRFDVDNQTTDYFDADGRGMRTFLMRTPIDGARLTSGFGMRHHPILGYSKMHAGVDFAAPTGTPIYAAGDGTVARAGRNGGYGNYVQIKHRYGYASAYAHLNRIASAVRPGAKVRQGDVIGYVGTTGRSTGPHLHYEVHHDGKKLNPMSVDVPSGLILRGDDLERFKRSKTQIRQEIAALPLEGPERHVAAADNPADTATP